MTQRTRMPRCRLHTEGIKDRRCQRGLGGGLRQLKLQPALQLATARRGPGLADGSAALGQQATGLLLDGVQRDDAFQRLGGDLQALGDMDVEDPSPHTAGLSVASGSVCTIQSLTRARRVEASATRLRYFQPASPRCASPSTPLKRLRTYVEHPFLQIDNNPAERAMRPNAVGENTCSLMGSAGAGRAANIAFTLIETATLNDVYPETSLARPLERIPGYKVNRIDEQLPRNTGPAADPEAVARSCGSDHPGSLRP